MRLHLLWLCLVLGWTAASQAGAQPVFSVLVWLQGRDDGLLKTRIEGQTADLDVALLPIVRDGRLLSSRDRLTTAGVIMQETGARAVIYWEPVASGGRRLRVLSGERVFSRELGDEGAEDPARSATLESAALVVRTVLRNLIAGEPSGVTLTEALGELPPEAAPAPPPEREPPAPPPTMRPKWPSVFLSLGWQAAIDGKSPAGQHALSLSIGVEVSRLLLRLWLSGGIPAQLSDGNSSVSLSRHGFSLGVLGAALKRPRLRLVAGGLVGLCGYYRTTDMVAAGYEAAGPSFVPALCLTPQIELWLRPVARLPLYLEALAGVEGVFGRPRLGYSDVGVFVPRDELWPVQPVLGLSLLYLWERVQPATANDSTAPLAKR